MRILGDLRRKAAWCYGSDRGGAVIKALFTDGSAAMIWYRAMQWSVRHRLTPLAMLFNKINAVFCQCIIGKAQRRKPKPVNRPQSI